MANRLNKITTEEDIEIFFGGPSWAFEYHAKDPKEAISKIIKVVNILIEAKLFSRRIGFYDREMISNLGKESVENFIRKNIAEDNFSRSMYGDTTIYLPVDSYPGPKRSVDMGSIIEVDVYYASGIGDISVSTNSSIWMPFNYKGRPHIDVYTLNLNRLNLALVKIEALGLELTNDLHYCNERCIDSGYLLENYAMDYDCFGNCESDYIEGNDGIYGVGRTD